MVAVPPATHREAISTSADRRARKKSSDQLGRMGKVGVQRQDVGTPGGAKTLEECTAVAALDLGHNSHAMPGSRALTSDVPPGGHNQDLGGNLQVRNRQYLWQDQIEVGFLVSRRECPTPTFRRSGGRGQRHAEAELTRPGVAGTMAESPR